MNTNFNNNENSISLIGDADQCLSKQTKLENKIYKIRIFVIVISGILMLSGQYLYGIYLGLGLFFSALGVLGFVFPLLLTTRPKQGCFLRALEAINADKLRGISFKETQSKSNVYDKTDRYDIVFYIENDDCTISEFVLESVKVIKNTKKVTRIRSS